MRRDIGFYVEANIARVYEAYLNAATHAPFERSCKEEPYHTFSFGVNYSFKYNMNGGSCNLHFMPYGTGTAVNIRFSLAQGFGARCEKYADELNNAMQRYLPVAPRPASYNMDDFLLPQNQVTPEKMQSVAPAPQPVAPAPQPAGKFCTNCGKSLAPEARFCSHCGTAAAVAARTCPNCNSPAKDGAAFCANCGARL